jgi:hypothetical protein
MGYNDPDRDRQIADLRAELSELREQHQTLHSMWRAGLMAARADEPATHIEAALSGY